MLGGGGVERDFGLFVGRAVRFWCCFAGLCGAVSVGVVYGCIGWLLGESLCERARGMHDNVVQSRQNVQYGSVDML